MDLKTYQIKSRETAIYPNIGRNCYYPVLGLIGEVGEVLVVIDEWKKDIKFTRSQYKERLFSEISDVFWYLAQICTEFNLDLLEVHQNRSRNYRFNEIVIPLLRLAELTKKVIRDDNNHVNEERVANIKLEIQHIVGYLDIFIKENSFVLEEILDYNYNKLKSRQQNNSLHGDGERV